MEEQKRQKLMFFEGKDGSRLKKKGRPGIPVDNVGPEQSFTWRE